MERKNRKSTISDVAKLSGVSIATVSRYINDSVGVRPATAEKILNAIRTLDYQLPKDSPLLKSGVCTNIILINIPSISNPFYNDVVRGAQNAAARHGYYTFVNVQHLNSGTERPFISMLKNINPCGMIVLNSVSRDLFDKLYPVIPFVQCCEYTENQDLVPYVSIDDISATRGMMEYIFSTGHRKIAFLSGPDRYKYARQRLAGYLLSLEEENIPVRKDWIIQLSDLDFSIALSSIQQLMSRSEHPDAIFTVSDVLAAAAIQGCRLAGLKVPDDVVVTGFDNVDISQISHPSITTINQPKYQLGYTACELLIEKLKVKDLPPRQLFLNTELIIRESTKNI